MRIFISVLLILFLFISGASLNEAADVSPNETPELPLIVETIPPSSPTLSGY